MMVMMVIAMFCQKILHGSFPEPAGFYEMGILQCLMDERKEIRPEPVGNWEHETLFFPVEDRGRQVVCGELAHQVFGLVVLHLDIPWNLRQKFDQFMVKEWGPCFEPMCHGHAVGEHQGMFGQARDKVGIQHAIEHVTSFGVVERFSDQG